MVDAAATKKEPDLVGELLSVPLVDILPNPANGRTARSKGDLAGLAASIRESGVIQPGVAVRKGKQFQLVIGHRRLEASKLAGAKTMPLIVREMEADARATATIIENLQREPLHPLDQHRQYEVAMDAGLTPEQVAAAVGKSPTFIWRRRQLGKLTKPWQGAIDGTGKDKEKCRAVGLLSVGHLESVARLPEAVQDSFLRDFHDGYSRMALPAFDKWIGENLLNRLDTASWDLDDAELDKKAGACSACPHRTGGQPGLFGEFVRSGGRKSPDRCTHLLCFTGKQLRHVQRGVEAAQAEHGTALVVIRSCSNPNPDFKKSKPDHEFQACAKTHKKSKPAIYVDGEKADGEVRYVKKYEQPGFAPAATKRETRKTEIASTKLARLRKAHLGRIYSDVVEAFKKKLRPIKTPPKGATVDDALALLLDFGLSYHHRNGGTDCLFPVSPATKKKDMIAQAYRNLRETWLARLNWNNRDGMNHRYRECTVLGKLYKIDLAAMLKTATEAHPEPATWARLREDVKQERAKATKKAAKKPVKKKAAAK